MPDEINDAIRAVSMLVSYHTSSWTASVKDEAAAKAAAAAAGADPKAYNAVKNLMIGHDRLLKNINTIQERGRRTHKHFTLPWSIDDAATGPRLLPTVQWMPYMQAIAKINTEFHEAVTKFVTEYPTLSAAARARLNFVGDYSTLYPDQSELKGYFSMGVDFTPIPAGAEFKGLPEGVPAQLEESYERRLKQRVRLAVKASLDRARDPIQAFVDRVGMGETTMELSFREPTVAAVRELPALLRAWNVIGHEPITDLANDIERVIGRETAATLKTNESTRAFVVKELRGLLDVISTIEGDF